MGLRQKCKKLINTAADVPWASSAMSEQRPTSARSQSNTAGNNGSRDVSNVANATIAAFSPNQQTATRHRNRAGVVIHQKSALLTSTPPQITRALAYSHPFILPLNALAGLITWTTDDKWESFLFVASFWFLTLYLDTVVRWAGPLVAIAALVLGMHSRKYSPLTSKTWSTTNEKSGALRARATSTSKDLISDSPQQRKSLDEILETLRIFSNRCDVLIDPFLQTTDFLSTQVSLARSDINDDASIRRRPALTALFLRLVAITPIWVLLALRPIGLITTTRVTLVIGTIGLTWHSAPARATRTILWRSRTVRQAASLLTGLHFSSSDTSGTVAPRGADHAALTQEIRRRKSSAAATTTGADAAPGVSFTFTVYENQRRWVALGFTANLLPNERAPWTEEHGAACPPLAGFPLPDTGSDSIQWQWVEGSEWRLDPGWSDGASGTVAAGAVAGGKDDAAWVYYDNKWKNGSKTDDWSKWTRRRRWVRDAALVEVAPTLDPANPDAVSADKEADTASVTSSTRKKKWFGGKSTAKGEVKSVVAEEVASTEKEKRDVGSGPEDDVHTPLRYRETQLDRSIGDGIAEGLS